MAILFSSSFWVRLRAMYVVHRPVGRLLIWLGLCSLVACANPIPPTGGERDEEPPRIVTEKSTANFQTNFRPERIELTFDEWVKVQDAFTEIIASPPLDFDVKLRGKTVQLILEDVVWRDSATYVINFGEAIKDLTESNPTDDLRFVFSTGPTIDSLEVAGTVIDAYTGEPVEDILFMLYENLADSVVRTEKPFYFARTDTSGHFRVSNVRPGAFKAFALADGDRNYRYNQPTERIGFPDTLLVAGRDSAVQHTIRLFTPLGPTLIAGVDTSRYGRASIGFNQVPYDVVTTIENSQRPAFEEREADSLRIFYVPPDDRSVRIRLQQDTLLDDTLYVRPPLATLRRDTFRLTQPASGERVRQNPVRPLVLQFSHPLANFDTNRILLTVDTTLRRIDARVRFDTTRQRNLSVGSPWRADAPYQLTLLPGAVTDWYGRSNVDTFFVTPVVDAVKSFGNFIFTFTEADPEQSYVVRLMGQGSEPVVTYLFSGQSQYARTYTALPPGDYRLEIITDLDNNGRWTPGDYDTRRQPEPVRIRPLENLRANWDVEATVRLEE